MKKSSVITWVVAVIIGLWSAASVARPQNASESFNTTAFVFDFVLMVGVVWAFSAAGQWIYHKVGERESTERR